MKLVILYLTLCVAAFVGCTNETPGTAGSSETAISGNITIQVDEEVLGVVQSAKTFYDVAYPNAHVTLEPVSAQTAVSLLLSHESRGAIIAREYLTDEQVAVDGREGAKGFPRTLLARDALVLVCSKSFPYDTMHAPDVISLLQGNTKTLDNYPLLKRGTSFLVPGSPSSVFGNVVNVLMKGKLPAANAVYSAGSKDSLVGLVKESNNRIGFGYLSQYWKDTTVKLIRLSYVDSSGYYEGPKPVHASYVIMGKYPFPVNIYFVLRDKAQPFSLPSGFMQYLARDGKAQRAFLDAGIEPGFAKIELVLPE